MSNSLERIKELFLFDIIVATQKIRYIAKDFEKGEDLKYSFKDWDTIVREFEIVGEAMRYCLNYKLFNEEKDKRAVIDFRNVLIHKYFGIDADEVLNIAKKNLDWLDSIVVNRINKIEESYKQKLIKYMIEENSYLDFVVDRLKALK